LNAAWQSDYKHVKSKFKTQKPRIFPPTYSPIPTLSVEICHQNTI